jgi:protein-S-isoprenylcysteine O-methyltransferase Ste14
MMRELKKLADDLTTDFLGGPKPWKLSWVINFQKGATFLFLGVLMWWYQNTTTAAWIYLALHGTYGLVWLLKDLNFPDPGWQKKVTIAGGLMAFFAVLLWYWVIGWLLISQPMMPDYPLAQPVWFALCISLCVLGCVIMIAADAQKYYTLKYRKELITEGIHSRIRHPNYLGEMMIYSAFGLLAWHWLAAVILLAVWSLVFVPNMVAKERSLSRYPEWPEYRKKSGWLLPFL